MLEYARAVENLHQHKRCGDENRATPKPASNLQELIKHFSANVEARMA
jgi:hypothetical protein